MQPELAISSIGAPHEIHANRVVANMMRHFAKRHVATWELITAITKNPLARDGNARAQGKLEAKVQAAGAAWKHLEPGKRGKYRLIVSSWVGWNPSTDSRILSAEDEIERPWLALDYYTVAGLGRGLVRYSTRLAVFISHHSLSRTVQRWAARNLTDVERVIKTLAAPMLDYIVEAELKDEEWRKRISPDGVRLRMPRNGPVLVCKPHDKFKALVLVTDATPPGR
jgi:hypothetical protein